MLRAGYHVHDGFYLRLAAGVGGGHVKVSADGAGAADFKIGGPGLALNLWIGGTPWRGVALGGMLGLQGMGDGNVVAAGNETEQDMSGGLFYVGPFIDAFPDPLRGLHLGGSLGLVGFGARGASDALRRQHGVTDYNAGGLGASAWVGYMGWVGPEFSLGGMLQLTVFGTGKDQDDNNIDRKASGYALSLNFTALYH
jgi:hypothetical protein